MNRKSTPTPAYCSMSLKLILGIIFPFSSYQCRYEVYPVAHLETQYQGQMIQCHGDKHLVHSVSPPKAPEMSEVLIMQVLAQFSSTSSLSLGTHRHSAPPRVVGTWVLIGLHGLSGSNSLISGDEWPDSHLGSIQRGAGSAHAGLDLAGSRYVSHTHTQVMLKVVCDMLAINSGVYGATTLLHLPSWGLVTHILLLEHAVIPYCLTNQLLSYISTAFYFPQ